MLMYFEVFSDLILNATYPDTKRRARRVRWVFRGEPFFNSIVTVSLVSFIRNLKPNIATVSHTPNDTYGGRGGERNGNSIPHKLQRRYFVRPTHQTGDCFECRSPSVVKRLLWTGMPTRRRMRVAFPPRRAGARQIWPSVPIHAL
jgi:hypothetical protein